MQIKIEAAKRLASLVTATTFDPEVEKAIHIFMDKCRGVRLTPSKEETDTDARIIYNLKDPRAFILLEGEDARRLAVILKTAGISMAVMPQGANMLQVQFRLKEIHQG